MSGFYILLAISGAAAPHGEHAEEHAQTFAPLDVSTFPSQIFWLLLTFGILLLMLSKVLLPRLGGILEDRSNKIANDLDGAARMQREAEAAEKAYEQSLKDARAKAHNVAETTRASVNDEIEAEMAIADAEAIVHLEAAEAKIKALRSKALTNVDNIASDTAKALVEKLFSGKITTAAAAKAVKAQG